MNKRKFKYVVEFGVLENDSYRLRKKFFRSRRKAIAFYNELSLVFLGTCFYCELHNLSLCYSIFKDLISWNLK